ncbi:serine hydrolase domain-containing protein [Anaeromicropila herbilytica]|uniref:Serine hydrolase n=1 Tax=Anaeromicropila herbilytica TaxID=2785025 RepID=A0A7R7EQI9_9FIRM|nr:serine hydrolase domain-containing protein [Anaeromicropila herbilytica]BCN32687.1 serine hydrolase [Anaeromicropila herbilytica]
MELEQYLETQLRGCIQIKEGKNIVAEKAFGYADLANEIPNTVDTKFATASAGKVFVATGILQLIEAGKLSFTDTIGKLLDIDLKAIDPDITVEQLLTHTSGIPDYFDESVMEEYEELWIDYPNYKIRTNQDLLPLFIDKPMMYPKGTRFQYNNTGYVCLGMVIEAITGMPFDVYLKENIFDKYEMFSTGYYELDRLPSKCANSYIFEEERNSYRTNIYSVDVKGTGAGGAFTTVGDISKFWEKLLSGELISSAMVTDMLKVHSEGEDGYYGYGVWLKKESDGTFSPYFQGCDPGVSFISVYQPKSNRVFTLVSNYGDNVWKITRELKEQYLA